MRREEIRAAIGRDPEAMVDLLMSLMAQVEELERRLAQNSMNSSRPPSSDPAADAQAAGWQAVGAQAGWAARP